MFQPTETPGQGSKKLTFFKDWVKTILAICQLYLVFWKPMKKTHIIHININIHTRFSFLLFCLIFTRAKVTGHERNRFQRMTTVLSSESTLQGPLQHSSQTCLQTRPVAWKLAFPWEVTVHNKRVAVGLWLRISISIFQRMSWFRPNVRNAKHWSRTRTVADPCDNTQTISFQYLVCFS